MPVNKENSNNETTPLLSGVDHSQEEDRATGSTSSLRSSPNKVTSEDLDALFTRWLDYIARRNPKKRKNISALEKSPQFLFSCFEKLSGDQKGKRATGKGRWEGYIDEKDFVNQLASVKVSIGHGINPKMILTGSSGSYFIRACLNANGSVMSASDPPDAYDEAAKAKHIKTVAVFKPNDEEPYGNLNPKRVFLRRYLWWAMGRPCLIPSFSYLSEVGASVLDHRLRLNLVPSTRLVELSSSKFSYAPKDRKKGLFREKIGSYQNFLHGYVNVSTFLRAHPWPSRPRNLLEQDLEAENHAHGRAKARARKSKGVDKSFQPRRGCFATLGKLNCCASSSVEEEEEEERRRVRQSVRQEEVQGSAFSWTKDLMQDFRLDLEKLVCLDYLMRNTDRGLDNFMVKVEQATPSSSHPSKWRLTLAAIDNSLAFPWKHPAGIRSYPWGWLYLPTDLIGGNFSPSTRQAFIPYLNDANWWNETRQELESLFCKDEHFDEKKFEGQMEVLRGQGWNLLESLRNEGEGPLELCARQKQMVKQETRIVEEDDLTAFSAARIPLTPAAEVINRKYSAEAIKPATPQTVPNTKRDDAVASKTDVIHPRSLPETIDEDRISHRWNQASVIDGISVKDQSDSIAADEVRNGKVIGKAYRGKMLGIDVLTSIDKSTSKAKRPIFRKAFTGQAAQPSGKTAKESRRGRDVRWEASEELESSVTSLPGLQQSPPFLSKSRRRNGSVGDNWSISSVFDRSNSSEQLKPMSENVQVIVERLESDNGIAWQTYLGLQ
ncbi:hypothetical protein CBS101457_002350 [Exobasidium rhododendri]|nr:hypothetical protein CBS101457_002350 [Exobasidium rhododendri]